MSDLRQPTGALEDSRVSYVEADVQDLPFADSSFDRLIATCLLHHINDPILALTEMRRVVRPGGAVSILIAADPGFVYRFAQGISSGRQHQKAGFAEWRTLHAMEHRNHAGSLHRLINYEFRRDQVRGRGFPIPVASWWNLNLFAIYQVELERG